MRRQVATFRRWPREGLHNTLISVLTSELIDLQRGEGLCHPQFKRPRLRIAAEVACLANRGRTHAKAASDLRRTSQRLANANSVCNWVVFLASPP